MNIYDISKKAGVSIATVSRVINGNEKVRPKTREKVLMVMKENNYKPNAFARGLGLNSMQTVGIMCSDSSDPYMAKGIYHLEQDLRKNHYDVLLCCTGYDLDERKKYMDLLISKRVDAIILLGSNFIEHDMGDNEYIRKASEKLPIVLVNGLLENSNIYSCICDDYQAVYETTKTLLTAGHKRIMYIYNSLSYSGDRKVSGYMKAINEHYGNQANDFIYTHYVNGTVADTRLYLNQLPASDKDFTAVICSDDSLAIGVIKYAKDNHLSVPDDLSIVGYNNSILSTCSDPELTTIDSRIEDLCYQSIQTLMDVLDKKESSAQFIFPAPLIKRETTAI